MSIINIGWNQLTLPLHILSTSSQLPNLNQSQEAFGRKRFTHAEGRELHFVVQLHVPLHTNITQQISDKPKSNQIVGEYIS
jgi:hypothetical protein